MHSSQNNQVHTWHKTPVILVETAKVSLIIKYISCPFFNIAYYNYNCHSSISIVVYKVLFIIIFKLSILNQHKLIISYSNRLHTMYVLILISLLYSLLAKQNEYKQIYLQNHTNITKIHNNLNFVLTCYCSLFYCYKVINVVSC